MQCSMQPCNETPMFMCKCTEENLQYCYKHIRDHFLTPGQHDTDNLFIKIYNENSLKLTAAFDSLLIYTKNIKEQTIKEASRLIKKIISKENEILEELKNIEVNLNCAIEILCKQSIIEKKDYEKEGEKLVKSFLEDFGKFKEFRENIESKGKLIERMLEDEEKYRQSIERYNIMKVEIEQKEKIESELKNANDELRIRVKELEAYEFVKDFINPAIIEDFDESKHNSEHIYYFNTSSKDLITVNFLEDKDSIYHFNDINHNMCFYAGYCNINQDLIFYYGGYNADKPSSHYYLINVRDKNVLKFGNRNSIRNPGCCLYKNEIYIFGGSSVPGNAALNMLEKYDFVKDSWKTLGPMLEVNHVICTVALEGEILYTGYNTINLQSYNVEQNKHTIVLNTFSHNNKVFFLTRGRFYIFNAGKLYESSLFSYNSFSVINSSTGLGSDGWWIINKPQKYKEYVYFLLATFQIFRFNSKTKEFKEVRKVNYN